MTIHDFILVNGLKSVCILARYFYRIGEADVKYSKFAGMMKYLDYPDYFKGKL
mgnify:CR=1 FL=1